MSLTTTIHNTQTKRYEIMENIYTKTEVTVTTKSGIELMVFVVFVPYLDKYMVDNEVNIKHKDGSWYKRCIETSVMMSGSRSYERAMELAASYLEGYAVNFDD